MSNKQIVFAIVAFLAMFAASVSAFTLCNIGAGIAWLCAIVWFVLFVGIYACYIDNRIETAKKDRRITELVKCNDSLSKDWYNSQEKLTKAIDDYADLVKNSHLLIHGDIKAIKDSVKEVKDDVATIIDIEKEQLPKPIK